MNWRSLFRGRQLEKQLDRELRFHIEARVSDLVDGGLDEQEARRRVQLEFGRVDNVKEDVRDSWGWMWLEHLWQDLRFGVRTLSKNPGFTLVAVLSLAMGVGANCAMFSLADALLLRPLPVPDPGGVLVAGSTQPLGTTQGITMSYPDYRDLRDRSRSFRELAAYDFLRVRFATGPEGPLDIRQGVVVSGNYFSAMQVEPALGRVFQPSENEVPGRDAVMILSDAFWKAQFAADPGVLGRTARVDGIDFTIVGVMPEEFTGADQWIQPNFYLPVMMRPRLSGGAPNLLEDREARVFDVVGRLGEGVTLDQARAEGAVIGRALAAQYPDTNRNYSIELFTEREKRLEEGSILGPIVAMLMLLALAVLLVACANVAGLLTSRAPARAREMSVRVAIGAGRARLVRQLLTESVILALLGAAGGVAFGYAGVEFLKQWTIVASVDVALSFRLDERALLFSLAAAVASVFLFGLLPAIRTARADLTGALRAGGSRSASTGRPRFWTRNALVAGQVALSIVLLTVASIMYLTFQRDLLAGPGFETGHRLMASFDPSLVNYSDARMRDLYRDLPDLAREIPGVRSATVASGFPGSYDLSTLAVVPEHYDFPEGQESAGWIATLADESYFATTGVGIVRGRGFTTSDGEGARPVAVINEAAAAQYWPGQDVIGKRLRLNGADQPWMQIVGVARNVKFQFLVERPRPALYIPFAQHSRPQASLLLETAGDPASVAAPLREIVRGIDATLPVFGVRNYEETWSENSVKPSLLIIKMIAAMGAMGVLLALTGLYGLMAYSVSARQREIGIRMAIGAQKNNILTMMLRQGLLLAGSGTLVGIVAAFWTGRLIQAAFPTHTPSVLVYVVVIPAVFVVTMLAAFVPARRASRVDPVTALRQD